MEIKGSLVFEYGGAEINMTRPWKRMNIFESLENTLGKEVLSDDGEAF